jgi:putative redox protein
MSGNVTVRENGLGRYQQEVIAGQHHLLAGEPAEMGGDDAGPAPFDYVMAGLGACTSITLRMYAERKGLHKVDVDGVARNCIHRQITLDGELSAEQRQRMLEIANKCPVHRALAQSFLLDCALND